MTEIGLSNLSQMAEQTSIITGLINNNKEQNSFENRITGRIHP